MQYKQPKCLNCKLFKSAPKVIGGKATCLAYPNGIPKKIFFEAGNCTKKPKATTKKATTKKTKAVKKGGAKSGSRKKQK